MPYETTSDGWYVWTYGPGTPNPPEAPLPGQDQTIDEDEWVEVAELVVIKRRTPPSTAAAGGGGGYAPTGTTAEITDNAPETPHPSEGCGPPPIGPTPDGVSIEQIRKHAAALKELLNTAPGGGETYESGGFVYVDTLGNLGHTALVTNERSDEEVSVSTAHVPDGARIVGWVHTHPPRPGQPNQKALSDVDRTGRRLIGSTPPRGVTVDPKMMSYVIDLKDENDMYEFGSGDLHGSGGGANRIGAC